MYDCFAILSQLFQIKTNCQTKFMEKKYLYQEQCILMPVK